MPKNIHSTMLKITILSISLQDIAAGSSTPAIAYIIKAFPSIATAVIMSIATIPSLAAAIVAPIYGKINHRLPRKTFIYIGFAFFIIGGSLPVVINSNIYLVLLCRVLLGIGSGILLPISQSLVAEFYDGNERDTTMGYTMTFGCMGGIVTQMIGGKLANIGWNYAFIGYLFPIISLILVSLFFVEPPKKNFMDSSMRNKPDEKEKTPAMVWIHSVLYLIYTVFIIAFVTNISVLIVGENIGDAVSAGVVLSLFNVGSLAAGFTFGKIIKRINGYITAFGYLATAFGFMMVFTAYNLNTIIISSLVIGFGMGIVIPSYYTIMGKIAPASLITFSMSLVVTGQGVGQFLQPFIYDKALTAMNQTIGRFPMIISSLGLFVMGGLLIIYEYISTKKASAGRTLQGDI